jgi:hypothetical protein
MRNISFNLTVAQFLDGTKDVTRRLGWRQLKAGDHLMACRKCQGLKPGEAIERLGEIEVVRVSLQLLGSMVTDPEYGQKEAAREGFPNMSGKQFCEMFQSHMKKATPGTIITRIEFRRVNANVHPPQGRWKIHVRDHP